MTSLTREAARRRARQLQVAGYAVSLDFTAIDGYFRSVTTIAFRCTDSGTATFVDITAAQLHSARLNGRELDLDACHDPAAGRLLLPGSGSGSGSGSGPDDRTTPCLAAENELVVDAAMAYSHDGEGMHRHVDPADGQTYLYAMSFLDAAPRWFACFDQPDLKAPVALDVRAPTDWIVAGNGPATELEPGHWQVAATGPLATYFTTVIAGPYHQVRDRHDGIPLVLHVRQSLAQHLDRDADELLGITRHCLDELHRLFGVRYPWGEYHQAFVPEFNAGAMENPGCVTLRDEMIFRSRATDADRADRAVTIAHEMAHMWFGDLVTMRWWDDLWLNESFAEYLGHRVIGPHTWTAFGIERKSWGYAADTRPSTHPVAGNGAVDAASALDEFDGISYAKGASALRQLSLFLGDEVFLGGLRRYIGEHARGNAEFGDLVAAWKAAGADPEELDAWTLSWLRTTGLDTLSVDGDDVLRASPDEASRVHAVAVASFDARGVETARGPATLAAGSTRVEGHEGAALVLPDAADETWAKLSLPAAAWARMPRLLPTLAEPRTRVAVWNALRLAVADAEVDPWLAVDVVVAALPGEQDAVIADIGRWATRTVAGSYLDDATRGPALARIAACMLATAEASDEGSGRQLAAVRVAIAASADPDLLAGWRRDGQLPGGVDLDVDLRWAVLTRLATLGALSEADIDDEEAADRSTNGAVHAANCRAARPDAGAKGAAWRALTTDLDRPNHQLYALATGFWVPGQAEMTAPYVSRYFAEIPDVAAIRSGWVVKRLALLAYPWTAVRESTVEATQALLARTDLSGNVRRSVVDAGDDLRRALVARVRYGA